MNKNIEMSNSDFTDVKRAFVEDYFEMLAAEERLKDFSPIDEQFPRKAEKPFWMLGELINQSELSEQGYNDFWQLIAAQFGETITFVDPEIDEISEDPVEAIIHKKDGPVSGHIYIAKNEGMPGILKIGMTTKSVHERLSQLSKSTSAPFDFRLVESFHCEDVINAEAEIHEAFSKFRPNKLREFFSISEDEAIYVCRNIIENKGQ
jgi:hypothetical protein